MGVTIGLIGRMWIFVLILAVLSCRPVETHYVTMDEVRLPVPEGALGTDLIELDDGGTQLSFEVPEPYRSSRIMEFYSSWAQSSGWERIPPGSEEWGSASWVSYLNAGTEIDMWGVHWQSPDRTKSLRVAVMHQGDRTRQSVYVVLSLFYLLEPQEDLMTLGDYIDQGLAPDEALVPDDPNLRRELEASKSTTEEVPTGLGDR